MFRALNRKAISMIQFVLFPNIYLPFQLPQYDVCHSLDISVLSHSKWLRLFFAGAVLCVLHSTTFDSKRNSICVTPLEAMPQTYFIEDSDISSLKCCFDSGCSAPRTMTSPVLTEFPLVSQLEQQLTYKMNLSIDVVIHCIMLAIILINKCQDSNGNQNPQVDEWPGMYEANAFRIMQLARATHCTVGRKELSTQVPFRIISKSHSLHISWRFRISSKFIEFSFCLFSHQLSLFSFNLR